MESLYEGQMAKIYEIMYQTFINYDEEFDFYKKLIEKYNGHSTLEIGAGTGQLACRFTKENFKYTGLDYSADMLQLAQKRCPNTNFIHADMRNFTLETPVDSIIMTGRTSSYIITNQDFYLTLDAIHKNLKNNHYLIFDFIDANRYIPFILKNKDIEHKAITKNKTYSRIGNWYLTENDNFLLNWKAEYYLEINAKKEFIQKDCSTVRVFTKDEITLFLNIKGFEVVELIDRKTYAYDTYVVIAKKIN